MTRAIVIVACTLAGCSEDPVAAGKRFAGERGCAQCHAGPDGSLSGQAAPQPGTMAYPTTLTPDRATGLGGWADVAIVRAIRFGVDDEERVLCAPMPRYDGSDAARPYLGDGEAGALVAYLRSLRPVARPDIPASRCAERGTAP